MSTSLFINFVVVVFCVAFSESSSFVGVSIGFDPVSYEVQEADGTVSFDIVNTGQNDVPVTVLFSTVDGTAIGMGNYIVS